MKKQFFLIILSAAFLVSELSAAGFKLYGYKTRKQGEVELVYFNNYYAKSDLTQSFFGNNLDKDGHMSHYLEIEYGLSNRWTVSAYFDFEQPRDENLRYTRMRSVFFRYRFLEKGDRFFDTALYIEYYLPKKSYKNEEELEVKLILEKPLGQINFLFNPSVEKALSGPEVEEGLKFNYATGFYWKVSPKIRLGMELFGKIGELSDPNPGDEQRHWIFPAMKIKLFNLIGWDLGAGIGLTDASDDLIVKNIFSIVF
jgi:hypothetical protein